MSEETMNGTALSSKIMVKWETKVMTNQHKGRKDSRRGPIDRFMWKDGDVVILNDPRENRKKQEQEPPESKGEKPHEKGSE